MPPSARPSSSLIRFGVFELDLDSLELRKAGRKVRLEGQPVQVLRCLLERPGHPVSREELQHKLWPSDTFVDFEHGLNSAIKRLRQALDDSAETPRFVETLPRRGYRFIYPVAESALAEPGRRSRAVRGWIAALTMLGTAVLAITFGLQQERPAAPLLTSIAVLPLDNLTGEADQDYLVDGLHDEVITELAQIGTLKVISRTSVMRYKRQKKPLREIATDLGVDGVLEGAVRRDGERWHVTAQLISARDDHHLWAQSYERGAGELTILSREIARGVAGRLGITLSSREQARLGKTEARDPAALTAYFKGKYYASKWTPENAEKAVRFLQEALDVDPTYAAAWASLGGAYHRLSGWSGGEGDEDDPEPEFVRRAEAALMRAVELDPMLREPHQALGRIRFAKWDWAGGAQEFERAHELDPGHAGFPVYLLHRGKFDEAVEAIRRNAQLNPLGYASQLTVGYTAFKAGRFDAAIVGLKKTIELDPASPLGHFELAWAYAKKAMYAEAIAECETSLALTRRTRPKAVMVTGCPWVYAVAGRRREALEFVHRGEMAAKPGSFIPLAHVYDALGDREQALAYLQKACDRKSSHFPQEWYTPMLSEETKADPRFQDLIRRTGHPWARFPGRRVMPLIDKTRAGGQS